MMEMRSYCSNVRLYQCWANMKARCNNKNKPDSQYYSNKGITYCKEWERYRWFEEWALQNGYADSLTLDRIDGNKGYYPENCRWITIADQQRNRSNNLNFCYKGNIKTLTEWAREFGIDRTTLHDRIFKFGYSFEEAITAGPHARNAIVFELDGAKYSQSQFAKILGVSATTIMRWRKKGYTPEHMKGVACRR